MRGRSLDLSVTSNSKSFIRHLRKPCALLLALCVLACADDTLAQVQPPSQRLTTGQQQALRTKLNDGTVMVATSHPGASYLGMASDMASVFAGSEDLRLLAVTGSGDLRNLRDLLFLRSIDLAIVPANVLAHAKTTEVVGAGLTQRVAYITKLYSEELHLLVGRGVTSIEDLRGKQVAVPLDDGMAHFTAGDLFGRLGLKVELVSAHPADAIEKVGSGSLAAVLLVGGKPLPHLARLPKDGSIQLLGLAFPTTMEEAYSPGVFTADDYPLLIPPGQIVETLAVSPVLLAIDSKVDADSARRVAKIVPALLGGLSELAIAHRHPKWKEVNIAATLPGWTRVAAAEEWLAKAREQQAGSLQKRFEEFLRATRKPGSPELTPAEQARLLEEFVRWTRKSLVETSRPTRQ